MSPEQAMGEREITARSDVYALGAVLYEMLTGEPPFTGATAQAVVARVLTETPAPARRRSATPFRRHVEAAVLTALEKLPADRFASAAEFADALKDKTLRDAPRGCRPRQRRRPRRRRAAPLAHPARCWRWRSRSAPSATVAALWGWLRPDAGAAADASSASRSGPTEALQPPPTRRAARASRSRPTAAPLVYIGPAEGAPQLWLRRLDQLDATPIAGTEGASSPFFSPDGRRVGFIKNGTDAADRLARRARRPSR